MRSIDEWLDEYSESHQHPVNKTAHWICVPLILFSLLGILWSIPFFNYDFPIVINWAVLLCLFSLVYYFFLSWKLAIGMIVIASVVFGILFLLDLYTKLLWVISIIIFVLAWIGQFLGHYIEGKRPSFYKDIQFLLIGPLWLLASIYRKLNLVY